MNIPIQLRNGSLAPNAPSSPLGIGEPSFADAIAVIAGTSLLEPKRKTHLITSLRQFARYLGQPVEAIPARFAAIRSRILALHPVQLGVNPKTFANHRANVRAPPSSSSTATDTVPDAAPRRRRATASFCPCFRTDTRAMCSRPSSVT